MTQQELELSKGWVNCKFSDVIYFLTDFQANGSFEQLRNNVKKFKKKDYAVLVRLTDLKYNLQKSDRFTYTNKHGYEFLKKSSLHGGEILVSCVGEPGQILIMPKVSFRATLAPNMFLVYLNDSIEKKYFYYFSSGPSYLNQIDRLSSGSNQGKMNKTQYRSFKIPLCPLNEQKRIVSKIEELFSKIDSTKKSLKYSKLQLVQYRHSLLKSAFEGKLTKKWREQNKPSLEVLLEKIQLNKKNQNTKLQKLKPFSDKTSFTIPPEWNWTRIGIISNEIQYGTSDKASTKESKLPVLRMGNIQDGVLNFDKLKYYPDNWKHKEQYLLKDGDVLFNRTNSAELVGKTAIYRHFHPTAVFAGYLIRVKILDEIYAPFLLTWYLNSIFGKSFVKSVVSQQVGQANVNGTKLAMMHIPLMSNEEQKEIITKIEQGFSLIENSQRIVNSTLQTLETMRMSVLKQAFQGKLVPQDPNDEPAEILLERIKKQKS